MPRVCQCCRDRHSTCSASRTSRDGCWRRPLALLCPTLVERLLQNLLDPIAQTRDGDLLLLVLAQQLVRVVAYLVTDVRVLNVEVVVSGGDVGSRHLPGLFRLHAGFEAV